jgi:hypothetical protein
VTLSPLSVLSRVMDDLAEVPSLGDSGCCSGTNQFETRHTLTQSGLYSVYVRGVNRETDLGIIHCRSPSLFPGSQECHSSTSAWGQCSFSCIIEI